MQKPDHSRKNEYNIITEKLRTLVDVKCQNLINDLDKKRIINEDYHLTSKRDNMLNMKKINLHYITKTIGWIEPFSSSDEEIDDEIKIKNHPSVKDVCEQIFDVNTLKIINYVNEFPHGVRHGLLFENIDDWWEKSSIFKLLANIPLEGLNTKMLNRYIGEIIIFKTNSLTQKNNKQSSIKYAFVKFYSKKICELFYHFLNHKFKQENFPLLNSDYDIINIFLCFDLTDLKNSLWYAIVLRNLSSLFSPDHITEFCRKFYKGVHYALPIKEIHGQYCTILVLDDCDEAENLCVTLNNKEIACGIFLKAHIHPKSSKFRLKVEKSHFSEILDNRRIKHLMNIDLNTDKIKKVDNFDKNSDSTEKFKEKSNKKILFPFPKSLDNNSDVFMKYAYNIRKLFSSFKAKFSPIRNNSPKKEKFFSSPFENLKDIKIDSENELCSNLNYAFSPKENLLSPKYCPHTPHRTNSPILGISKFDDEYFGNFNFNNSPILKNGRSEMPYSTECFYDSICLEGLSNTKFLKRE